MKSFLWLSLMLLSTVTHAAPVILIFGDSLSAGYGIDKTQSWPQLLAARIKQEALPYKVANASVSGETTGGGLFRFEGELNKHKPAVVVLELGANDGLRGLPIASTRQNLSRMIQVAQQKGARVLLLGMRLPPNFGPKFTREFQAMYPSLAQQHRIALVPFMLERIATDPNYFQLDGVHPTAAAQPLVLDEVWTYLVPLLSVQHHASRKSDRS